MYGDDRIGALKKAKESGQWEAVKSLRCLAKVSARRYKPTNCVVNAFVEATPISVPA